MHRQLGKHFGAPKANLESGKNIWKMQWLKQNLQNHQGRQGSLSIMFLVTAPYSHTFHNMNVMLPTEETKCISTLLDFGYLNVICFRQITGKLLGRIFGSFETVRSRVLCASIFPLVPLPSLWKKTCPQDSPYAQEEEEKCRGKSHT